MLFPRNVDWDGNGHLGVEDGWIELFNAGSGQVDLSGWRIELHAGRTITYVLPPGTFIPGQGYRVMHSGETQFGVNAGPADLALLFPDGRPADQVAFPQLRADESFSRATDQGGTWTDACVPSLNARNCRALATLTTSFNLPFFRDHIVESSSLRITPEVIATNSLLALILALAMGFFGNLLNDALESHEDQVSRWLAPAKGIMERVRSIVSALSRVAFRGPLLSAVAVVAKAAVLLLVYGLVLAFLDPNFDLFDRDGVLLVIALALSAGLISLTDDAAMFAYLRINGARSVIRLHGGNLGLVAITTLLSRLFGLAPGLLLGSPAGIEEIEAPALERSGHLIAVVATAIMAALAWFTAPLVAGDEWLQTLFLLIFAASVQTLFFEMMPFQYLHGRIIFEQSRGIWLALTAGATFAFLQTMLNPDGAFVSAFDSPNMRTLAVGVVVFCAFSAGMWYYLQGLDKVKAAPAKS